MRRRSTTAMTPMDTRDDYAPSPPPKPWTQSSASSLGLGHYNNNDDDNNNDNDDINNISDSDERCNPRKKGKKKRVKTSDNSSNNNDLSTTTTTLIPTTARRDSLSRQQQAEDEFNSSIISYHQQHRFMLLPYVIMAWLQLLFNTAVVIFLLFIGYTIVKTILADVDIKVEDYSAEILKEIALCSKNYVDNRCSPHERIPAMESTCLMWERCMTRDPTDVGRARVSAETFAEIINSFVDPISYKTMAFFAFMVFGFTFLSNFAFHFARSRMPQAPGTPPQHQQPPQQMDLNQYAMFARHSRANTPMRDLYTNNRASTPMRDVYPNNSIYGQRDGLPIPGDHY